MGSAESHTAAAPELIDDLAATTATVAPVPDPNCMDTTAMHATSGTVCAQTGSGNLLRSAANMGSSCGLASVCAATACISGIDPTLGDGAQTVLCLDICGAEADTIAQQRDPMDVVLVIDTSGSMCHVIQEVQETCLQVFTAMQSNDRISLVSFSTKAEVMLPMTTKASCDGFVEICQGIRACGGTNMEDGLLKGIGQFAEAGKSKNIALAIVLSDGSPNGGESNKDALCNIAAAVALQSGRAVTIHALGFTQNHRVDLMSQLPQASSGPPGSYYYLGTQADMPASVGDCLGSGTVARPCRRLKVSLVALAGDREEPGACSWYGPTAAGDGALLGLQAPQEWSVSALQSSERQVAVFVVPSGASGVLLHLMWESDVGPEKLEVRLDWSEGLVSQESILLPDNVPSNSDLERLGVISHVLRLQVAAALATLAVNHNVGDRYDALHGALLQCLALLQSIAEEANVAVEAEAVFLEGMLQALERDLGEALTSRDFGWERQGVLLSFSAEHFAMRSASSLTRVRTAYATRRQIQMRLRFLVSSAGDGCSAAKEACEIDESGLVEEERNCREALEEHTCYVTLSSWRECVLGLGLFVHPRTCRERRGGVPPQVDLVVDYVSAEAYNLGVRTKVQHAAVEGLPPDSGDEDLTEAPADVLQSSTRRRINAWLPLHINAANWSIAKTFAPSAFSLIATQLNAVFRPEDALKVCARLLCCAVVGFVRSDEDGLRTGASERAVQMYCDVHRLFLKMAEDYPGIRQMALQHVRGFISNPDMRTRKATPDLGLLITYLSILDEVTWLDLCDVFVPEMVRRAFGRMREPLGVERCESESDIIARFDALEPEHGRVILFFKVFNSCVARPSHHSSNPDAQGQGKPVPVTAVCDMYDRCWGQLSSEQCQAVLHEIKRMRRINSVGAVLCELLPFKFSDADVCELILWAGKHGQSKKAIEQWLPLQQMPTTLTEAWRWGRKMRLEFERDAQSILSGNHTVLERLNELLSMTKLFWQRNAVATSVPAQGFRYGSCEEACIAAAASRERAAERRAAKGKGKGKGKGEGKGKNDIRGLGCSNYSSDSDGGEARPCGSVQRSGEDSVHDRIVLSNERREPFDLKIVLLADTSGSPEQQCMSLSVCYQDDQGILTTGRKLRAMISSETGLDARKIRLVAHGARQVGADGSSAEPKEMPLSNEAVLASWKLEALGVSVDVQKKQRGGKKPGNGWHAHRSHGRTYPMCIAGAIVHATVFTKVDQYFTAVEDTSCLDTMAAWCKALKKDAVVVCGGGLKGLEVLQRQAVARSWQAVPGTVAGILRISIGSQKLLLLSEADAPECAASTHFYVEEIEVAEEALPVPLPEGNVDLAVLASRRLAAEQVHCAGAIVVGSTGGKGGKSCKGGQGGKGGQVEALAKDELPVPAVLAVPPEAAEAGLIIVIGGHFLRETASLSSVICAVHGGRRGSASVPMLHVITDVRQVILETEEQLGEVASSLSQDGRANTTVELLGQPSIPPGAVLLAAETSQSQASSSTLPHATELPVILSFKLRMPALGLITRLRDRYGCTISELFFNVLNSLITQTTDEAP